MTASGRVATNRAFVDPELVKVVLTAYNRRPWIEGAIESVLAQTHESIHLVIVDDASHDGTSDVARSYAAAQPERVTAIVKPTNQGVADSVRCGLQAPPDAPYVAILNDDDLWHPRLVERELAVVKHDPALGLVFAEAEVIDESGRPTGRLFSDVFGRFKTGDLDDVLRGNHACASTLLIRRDVAAIAAQTLPSQSLVFDYILVLLAAGYARIAMLDEPLALYRTTSAGLHTQDGRMWRDTTRARQTLFRRNAPLVARVGGSRAARRLIALRTLEVAILQLARHEWREYVWHASVVVRERSLRPTVWLVLHTLRTLTRMKQRP